MARRVVTRALVVRTVPYGESDVVATLLTEHEGKVAAIVRGARKGSRRVAGALEPMHTISVTYEDKGSELVTVKEAQIVQPRTNLLRKLESIEAAGTMLRWARHMFPPRTPEPSAFATLIATLDTLDAGEAKDPKIELARAGLLLLSDVGWGLELERCVRCDTPCPENASALVDALAGGIVCRNCGGARVLLRAPARQAAVALATRGNEQDVLGLAPHARAIIELVESAMAAHTGYS